MPRGTRYHVVSKIAHGGMAEIFLALQKGERGLPEAGRAQAHPAGAGRGSGSFVRMLVDEAHIASTLNHSNLVQVLDLGKSGEQYFLVLEFVDGWSLEQVRRRAQKAQAEAADAAGPLDRGRALPRARLRPHARAQRRGRCGIVHRDVTPQNVLLSQQGEVKLADFGIAKAVGQSEKSATGVIKGKFAYMSPEQSRGWPLDARSDLFSVGTRALPADHGTQALRRADRPGRASCRCGGRGPRSRRRSCKDLNPDVERLINRALRADRWPSAGRAPSRWPTASTPSWSSWGSRAGRRRSSAGSRR